MERKFNRRDFLRAAGVGTVSFVIPACLGAAKVSAGEKSNGQPNIIFIMADDHDASAFGCYGSSINKTPNLDRLAKEGMLFKNCFCTNSICAPSRAVILTGKYSHINGVVDNIARFDGSRQTFPKLLGEAGYETAMIGKWHLKTAPTGFDYWNILPGQGVYYNPQLIEMGRRKNYEGYVTDIITDVCLDWLKDRRGDRPFCLMYQHKAPHREWEPGPKHLNMYDGVEIPEPETFNDDYSTRSGAASQQEMTIAEHMNERDLKLIPPKGLNKQQLAAWNAAYGPKNKAFHEANLSVQALKKWKYQRYIKDYLRCVASIDDNIGRLLNYLDESGLAENTVVIYTSDQGFYLGDHGWFDKRFMYEQSLRMPLLVRYPKEIAAGSVSDDIVLNLDFAATFLDFAGVAKPADMQGVSFRSILKGKRPCDWRTSMYYHYYEYPAVHMVKRHYGVRTQRYKLMHFYYDIDTWELYDLEKDPYELNNVYGDPAYAEVVKELKGELERLRKQYGDSDELTQRFLNEYLKKQPWRGGKKKK